MYRYDLTDAQWEIIAPFLPHRYHHGGPGHPWKDHRPLINGIHWHLHTGAPWRDLPEHYGPWKTVYDRFNLWRADGTWARILDALLLCLDDRGLIDRDLWFVDASVIRASRAAAGAKKNYAGKLGARIWRFLYIRVETLRYSAEDQGLHRDRRCHRPKFASVEKKGQPAETTGRAGVAATARAG